MVVAINVLIVSVIRIFVLLPIGIVVTLLCVNGVILPFVYKICSTEYSAAGAPSGFSLP